MLSTLNIAYTVPPSLRPPSLRPTDAFLFKEPNPLYSCYVIVDPKFYDQMTIRCTQPDCSFSKVIKRVLQGTNNYKLHYYQKYKGILVSSTETA